MANSQNLEENKRILRIDRLLRQVCQDYGKKVTPLTTLLKKGAFSWTQEATKAFEKLKEAMCTIPVLATLDFTKTFIMDCDASGHGIDAVLMQKEGPLRLKATNLNEKNLLKPIYEKEMLAILHAVKK
jgi:hypothetical protein